MTASPLPLVEAPALAGHAVDVAGLRAALAESVTGEVRS